MPYLPPPKATEVTPLDILRKYWASAVFVLCRRRLSPSILSGKDTLALLPTGGGKSITFKLAMMCQGVAIVISPLVALMKDQVDQLREVGTRLVTSTLASAVGEILAILDNCIFADYKILYVPPERLSNPLFI